MERLEVSCAVRDIYIYIYIYVSRLRVKVTPDGMYSMLIPTYI